MEAIVLNRIHDLLVYRSWFRTNRWAEWPSLRTEYEIELRALVRLARQARRLEAARPDPVTLAGGYHDWQAAGPITEPELLAGYGLRR